MDSAVQATQIDQTCAFLAERVKLLGVIEFVCLCFLHAAILVPLAATALTSGAATTYEDLEAQCRSSAIEDSICETVQAPLGYLCTAHLHGFGDCRAYLGPQRLRSLLLKVVLRFLIAEFPFGPIFLPAWAFVGASRSSRPLLHVSMCCGLVAPLKRLAREYLEPSHLSPLDRCLVLAAHTFAAFNSFCAWQLDLQLARQALKREQQREQQGLQLAGQAQNEQRKLHQQREEQTQRCPTITLARKVPTPQEGQAVPATPPHNVQNSQQGQGCRPTLAHRVQTRRQGQKCPATLAQEAPTPRQGQEVFAALVHKVQTPQQGQEAPATLAHAVRAPQQGQGGPEATVNEAPTTPASGAESQQQ